MFTDKDDHISPHVIHVTLSAVELTTVSFVADESQNSPEMFFLFSSRVLFSISSLYVYEVKAVNMFISVVKLNFGED